MFDFDLHDSPKSSPKSATGSVRVMHFYIGDDAETFSQPADIRAVVT